jgi:hypothetical protein
LLAPGVTHAHADRWKIREKSIDAARKIALDFGIHSAVGRGIRADTQLLGQEFVLGAKRPHMHLQFTACAACTPASVASGL